MEDSGQMDMLGLPEEPVWDDASGTGEEPATVARRLRTLLLTGPLHGLHRNKNLRPDFRHIDVRTLALVALDYAIEGMGLEGGMTRHTLLSRLEGLAGTFAPDTPREHFRSACEFVLDGLLNAPRNEVFAEEYLAIDDSPPTERQFTFRLLQEEEHEGRVVLRASTYGINLYLRMLDTDVEDAQVATEAVLADQLRRGAIDRAAESAQQARLLSMSLENKIDDLLRRLRRDIMQVDYDRDLKPELDRAREHLELRSRSSAQLEEVVDQKLGEASGAAAWELAKLFDTLHDCRERHGRLLKRVLTVTGTFLDEQARQSFRRARSAALPAMEADVLRPALTLTAGDVEEMAAELIALFHPPRPPLAISFSNLIDRFLAPKQQRSNMQADYDDTTPVEVPLPPPRWPAEEHEALNVWLLATLSASDGALLSQLLHRLEEEEHSFARRHLLVLEALRLLQTDGSLDGDERFRAEPTAGHFSMEHFEGDDVLLNLMEPAS